MQSHLEAVFALSGALDERASDGAISDLPLADAAIVDAVADAGGGHAVLTDDSREGGLHAARLTNHEVSRGERKIRTQSTWRRRTGR